MGPISRGQPVHAGQARSLYILACSWDRCDKIAEYRLVLAPKRGPDGVIRALRCAGSIGQNHSLKKQRVTAAANGGPEAWE